MNKEEAEESLNQGHKITHEYFTENEYIHLVDGIQYFEDGVKVPSEWWNDSWKHNNWKIFK